MKITIHHILILLLIVSCKEKSQNADLSQLEQKIVEISEITGLTAEQRNYNHNRYHFPSSHPYHFLADSAATDDLLRLTKHQSTMVRIFSFQALLDRKYDKIINLVFDHLTDTSSYFISGCTVDEETVADYFVYTSFHLLDSLKKDSLRDLIVFNHTELIAFHDIAFSCEGHSPYYDRYKELSKHQFEPSIISAIASYNKESDIEFLKKSLDSLNISLRFEIIEKFPHDQFKPFFQDYLYRIEQDTTHMPFGAFYFSLASYKNEWSKTILKNLIKIGPSYPPQREHHLEYIMQATEKYDPNFYSQIRKEIMNELSYDSLGTKYFDFTFYHWW